MLKYKAKRKVSFDERDLTSVFVLRPRDSYLAHSPLANDVNLSPSPSPTEQIIQRASTQPDLHSYGLKIQVSYRQSWELKAKK